MFLEEVVGQDLLKQQIKKSIENGLVPHAQIFIDESGYGGLPLALSSAVMSLYSNTLLSEKKSKFNSGVKLLEHPDLHFVFPIVKTDNVKSKPCSDDFITDWFSFLKSNPYGSYSDWFSHINARDKQGVIAVNEIELIHEKLSLKSFAGKNKVCIIWGVDRMNPTASNKFLKLLEEPPKNTFFILIAEDAENLLPTVISRCQVICLKPVSDKSIKKYLQQSNSDDDQTDLINSAAGSVRLLNLLVNSDKTLQHESMLINLFRLAFRARGNKSVVVKLIKWVNQIALLGREDQKAFILFSIEFLRKTFLLNYNLDAIVSFRSKHSFDLKKLAPFVHSANFMGLIQLFENAYTYIERNANSKILFTDFVLQITRLLNKAEN